MCGILDKLLKRKTKTSLNEMGDDFDKDVEKQNNALRQIVNEVMKNELGNTKCKEVDIEEELEDIRKTKLR